LRPLPAFAGNVENRIFYSITRASLPEAPPVEHRTALLDAGEITEISTLLPAVSPKVSKASCLMVLKVI